VGVGVAALPAGGATGAEGVGAADGTGLVLDGDGVVAGAGLGGGVGTWPKEALALARIRPLTAKA